MSFAVLGAIGSVVGTIGSVIQLQYQAAIARANQKQQEYNADAASEKAQRDIEDLGAQARGELGQIRVAQAGSGLSIGSPGFGAGEEAFRDRAYEDAWRTQYAGNQQYAYYKTQANIEGTRARASTAAIGPTLISGVLNAAATLDGSGDAGSSLVSGARASPYSPGYIPLPRRRPTLSSAGIGAPSYYGFGYT